MAFKRILGKKEVALLDFISGGLILGAFLTPRYKGTSLFTDKFEKYYAKKKLKQWSKDDLIVLGGKCVKLTAKGKKLLKLNSIHDIQLADSKKDWDGIWHVISYDIPDNKKSQRDYFRRKLEELGFTMVQKSMFIFPYNCEEEVALLALELGISPFVMHLTTNQLPKEDKYLKLYMLDSDYASVSE